MELNPREREILEMLRGWGTIRTNGHFVLKSGLHSSEYVEKERVLHRTLEVSRFMDEIAIKLKNGGVEAGAVLGPGNAGAKLSLMLAYHLSQRTGREVASTDAHRVDEEFEIAGSTPGFRTTVRETEFAIRPAYATALRGKNVVLVEDVVTTGGTLQRLETLAIRCHARPVAAVCMVDRGGLDKLTEIGCRIALTRMPNNVWDLNSGPCPLCLEQVEVDTDVGHGAAFLMRRGR